MCCSSKSRNQTPRHHRRGYNSTNVPSQGPTSITEQTPLIADHASTVSGSPPSYHAAMKSEVPPYPAHGNNEKENKQDKKIKKDRKDKKDKDTTEVAFPTALAAIPEGSVEFNDGFAVVTSPNGACGRRHYIASGLHVPHPPSPAPRRAPSLRHVIVLATVSACADASPGEVYRLEMSTLSQQEIDCLEHGHQVSATSQHRNIPARCVFRLPPPPPTVFPPDPPTHPPLGAC